MPLRRCVQGLKSFKTLTSISFFIRLLRVFILPTIQRVRTNIPIYTMRIRIRPRNLIYTSYEYLCIFLSARYFFD